MKKLTATKNDEIVSYLQTEDEMQIRNFKAMYRAMEATVTVEDITEQLQQELINNEALAYLSNTDWVISKISEASLLGKDVSQLLEKYADVLEQREIKRNLVK